MREQLSEDSFDIGVIASFGKMVPDHIIDAFPSGMLVMHPSLLPKYRGPCPIQRAILNQDEFTGTSVIEITKGVFDAGDILAQSQNIPITEETRFRDLSVRLAELGGDLLADILANGDTSLNHFREKSCKQEGPPTMARMIKESLGELSFSELHGEKIQVRFNALDGSNTRPSAAFHITPDADPPL